MFLRNCSLIYFQGQMDYAMRLKAKLFRTKTLLLLPKTPPKSFFQKTRFWSIICYEIAPSPSFEAKRTMWRVQGKNFSERKLHLIFPREPPKSLFRKTCFQSEFFTKPPADLFSGPNKHCGAFREKFSVGKLRLLLTRKPVKSFFRKNKFSVRNFLRNFARTTPKSFFRKTRFGKKKFNETAPSPIFRAKQNMWSICEQNCVV